MMLSQLNGRRNSIGVGNRDVFSFRRKVMSGTYSKTILSLYFAHVFGPIANLKGHYFQPSLSVCVSLTGTSTLQRRQILTKLGHKDPTLI